LLSDDQKKLRVDASRKLLFLLGMYAELDFQGIATGDEFWFQYSSYSDSMCAGSRESVVPRIRRDILEISVYGEINYRLFLDVIKLELDQSNIVDITAIQAFILMNINENVVTIGEIIARGYYIGSNASYNIKKMIANGYINQTQSDYDKRAIYLSLSDKGLALCSALEMALEKHIKAFFVKQKGKNDIEQCVMLLKKIEHLWKSILSRRA
jgi:DNA-binding MarR family transcriptional regulator